VAKWVQLSFKASPEALDTVSNFLIERGSPGVVLERHEVRAFFPDAQARSELRRDIQSFHKSLEEIYPAFRGEGLRWSSLKDKNWKNSWRRFFTPQPIGKTLWVAPSWARRSPAKGRRMITIEPGMAFGTGAHFTTRTCLEFIERAAARFADAGFSALDVGTGSGILAIALAKLKARKVLALDIDPVAVRVADANIRRNRVEKIVALRRSELAKVAGNFDIVVANLTAETIVELAAEFDKKLVPGAYLIVAGILRPQARAVRRAFARLDLLRTKSDKEWSTMLLSKKG
jgi:ribosomal protein L11 methyltransferase